MGIFNISQTLNCDRLQKSALCLISANFKDLSNELEFLNFDMNSLKNLLQHKYLQVETEFIILESLLKWLCYKPSERAFLMPQLLSKLHLPLLDLEQLQQLVITEPILHKQWQEAINEAELYFLNGDTIHLNYWSSR